MEFVFWLVWVRRLLSFHLYCISTLTFLHQAALIGGRGWDLMIPMNGAIQ